MQPVSGVVGLVLATVRVSCRVMSLFETSVIVEVRDLNLREALPEVVGDGADPVADHAHGLPQALLAHTEALCPVPARFRIVNAEMGLATGLICHEVLRLVYLGAHAAVFMPRGGVLRCASHRG